MKFYFILLLGACIVCAGCSEQAADSQPESGHTALGTSAPPALNPVRTDSLRYLSEYIGHSPDSVALWKTEPLKSRLEDLLGDDFNRFTQFMQQATPLKQERVLYTIGKSNSSGKLAFLLIDVESNTMHVSIIEDGIRKQYQTPGEELHLPYEVELVL